MAFFLYSEQKGSYFSQIPKKIKPLIKIINTGTILNCIFVNVNDQMLMDLKMIKS